MKKIFIFAAYLFISGGLSAQEKKSLVDIEKELKQAKSTATVQALVESIAEATPQTEEDVATLGQLMSKYPTQSQQAMAKMSNPKLAKAVLAQFSGQAAKIKAVRAKNQNSVTKEDREQYLNSYMNSVAAINALGNMKNKEAIPVLRGYLDDADLAQAVSVALGRLGDAESLDNMLGDIEKRKNIDLSGYGDKGLVRIMEEIDKPGLKKERKYALMHQITGSRSPERKRLLKQLALGHKDRAVRDRAGQALLNSMLVNSEAGDAAFASQLLRKTKNEDSGYWAIHMFAGACVSEKKNPDASEVALLLDVLTTSSNYLVRQSAAESIGRFKLEEALPYLKDCIQNDKDSSTRGKCQSAYWEITGVIPPIFTEEEAKYFENYSNQKAVIDLYDKLGANHPETRYFRAKVRALQEYRRTHK
ncbi:MAG: hypothetical protein COX65_10335 [Elusimicrobia bacterium CG_4_10_14_0_2_um_filter_56_8]|nr:MAG: hypothetical protein AUJ51_05705 [Elusimicrobia bacterium CG1_02_56_21]PJA11527.1 MAG: hypothetical protein COX65_10335 [Elusimicrobia bacterium CG_4_10_14_0_2_um_filter_56_8]